MLPLAADCFEHFLHGAFHADERCAAHDAVADNDFVDAVNLCDRFYVSVVETASGENFQTVLVGENRHVLQC